MVFTSSGVTLDGVTADSDLDLATNNNANVHIVDGLTLSDATVYLGNAAGSTYGQMFFDTTETLGGTGTVVFGKNGSNTLQTDNYYNNVTLTVGPGITLRGSSGVLNSSWSPWGYTGTIVNHGTISADDSGGLVGGFVYDTGFSSNWWASTGSTPDVIDTSGVSNPAPQAVWQTYRYGSFSYNPSGLTPGANYTVALEFAEPSNQGVTAAGQRQFNVIINGTQVLTNFDIFATAGGVDKAIRETFTATADANGQITINLSSGAANYPLINGIEVLSGSTVVQAINCGELAGGTITINPNTFTNQGNLQATASTLSLNGAWSNTGTLAAGGGGTLNLGGTFTTADVANFSRSGGTVNLTGTLDNTGTTLALGATTGSWNLAGGTLTGGTLSESGGAELVFTSSGVTLDGVTADSDLDLATNNNANVHIVDGLTLSDATVYLGNAAGSTYGQMFFDTTETLGGTGTVVFGKNGSNTLQTDNYYNNVTLTVGPGITLRGSSGVLNSSWSPWGYTGTIVNHGTISADDSGGLVGGFVYDTGFSSNWWTGTGSTSDPIDTSGVSDPAPQAVYQTWRTGVFSYALGNLTPGASYTVALEFAEPSNQGVTTAGQRQFNVGINGTQVLTNFDIFATAGGQDTAVQETFTATADANGQITVAFSQGAANWPLVNGIKVLSGSTVMQAINCGELAGGTITINPGTFTNQGSLQASNGETLNLGGTFTVASLGTFDSNGGTVNLAGTLDNTGTTLALTAATGSLTFSGTIQGGTISASGGAGLISASGTLDGLTLAGCSLTANNAGVYIAGGLTLNNATVYLGNAAGSTSGSLDFQGTQALAGTGTVLLGASGSNFLGISKSYWDATSYTLTIAPGITVHGSSGTIGEGSFAYRSDTIVNQGTISADDSGGTITVNPGILTNQGSLQSGNGGTLNIAGMLDNSGSTLALTAATGSLTFSGTIQGGSISESGGAELISANGTLDGVTLAGDLDLASNNATVYIMDGLTLNNATVYLGNTAGTTSGSLEFQGTQTLGGTGAVLLGASGNNFMGISKAYWDTTAYTLTIGSGIMIGGSSGTIGEGSGYTYRNDTIINQGTISADTSGMSIVVNPTGTLANQGTIQATVGTLVISTLAAINNPGAIISSPTGAITVSGNLLGNTLNNGLYNPQGTLTFNGPGTATAPQLLEAMSQDLGNVSAGMVNNFVYGELILANNTYVQLVDQSHNAASSSPNAVYAQSIIVPAGCTLNLNGLHLYARAVQISGTILGGSISQIPNAGALTLATPTPGDISTAGQLDEWTFFDYGGRTVSILVNPGTTGSPTPVAPQLQWANVQLLDANNDVLASGAGASAGAIVSLSNIVLPADGMYEILINAPAGQTASTGNYLVGAYDVTPNVRSLNIGQTSSGTIKTPFALDEWNFSVAAGQQIQFVLAAASASGLAFTLTGPGGYTPFSDISTSSQLIDLAASGNYTLTAFGPNGATGTYSFHINQTSVTPLPLATTYNGTWAGPGQAQLFTIPVTVTDPLAIVLTDTNTADQTELYAPLRRSTDSPNIQLRSERFGFQSQPLGARGKCRHLVRAGVRRDHSIYSRQFYATSHLRRGGADRHEHHEDDYEQ